MPDTTKSQAIKANGFIFVSGQMPATLEGGKIKVTQGTVAEKTHSMCRNAATILEAAGSDTSKVVKATVSNLTNFLLQEGIPVTSTKKLIIPMTKGLLCEFG